ncbi:hypothetical protein [Vibrio maerlii]|uniref:hypothetical protein n=1 Tax=Vibrio maerlii TaxID=2231648 RepID=UPI000E3C7792|nr:hypothetical protein [Vibrio maerlii]
MNRRIIGSLMVLLMMNGCAETISERHGTQIDVVPWEYRFAVDIENSSTSAQQKAWNEMDDYVQRNWNILSSQQLHFHWLSNDGKTLADKYKKHLLSQGIASTNIHVSKGTEQLEDFDLSLLVTQYKAVTPVCEYEKIGNYGELPLGCYSEGARWKSVVHPERVMKSVK